MMMQRGFTLIEMAIVLVIVTLLLGGLAMPLSAQIQARRIAETNRTLDEAREAIIGYAMRHTVSPPSACTCKYKADTTLDVASSSCPMSMCPATSGSSSTLTLPVARHYLPCPNQNGDGTEGPRDAGRCLNLVGYLPWVTLGAAAQDAWGNRVLYAVSENFSNSMTGFLNTDSGDLQICNASANAGTSDCAVANVAAGVPVVLLSHGPNGWGALNINGSHLAAPTSADEQENANTATTDKEYVSRTPSAAGSAAGEFDDLVRWISADQLRGRICPAGGCP